MIKWLARRRVRQLDCQLVGLRARHKALLDVVRRVAPGSDIPGKWVSEMCDLPQRIAELEERRRQLLED